MIIIQFKNVGLVKDVTYRRNPYSNSGIYLNSAKIVQYRLVAENRREKEEAKKETANNTSTQKLYPQQKQCEYFQKCQESMNIILSSPRKYSMFVNLVHLSSNTLKDAF